MPNYTGNVARPAGVSKKDWDKMSFSEKSNYVSGGNGSATKGVSTMLGSILGSGSKSSGSDDFVGPKLPTQSSGGGTNPYTNPGSAFKTTASSGGGGGSSAAPVQSWQYKIGTAAGINQANSMMPGETWTNPSDGSVWTMGSDGVLSVKSASGNYTPNVYTNPYISQLNQANEQNESLSKAIEQMRQSLSSMSAPTYSSAWQKTADQLAKAALAMKYDDFLGSDAYSQLADRYGKQGRLAMQDTLAQVAARTGGLASSYATSTAQQRYADYMSQLEEAARAMYESERGDAIENAQLAGTYSDRDYSQYLNQLAQFNQDRGFMFDTLSQALEESRYAQQWQNTLQNQDYERRQAAAAAEQSAREEAENANLSSLKLYADTLAKAGDFSGYLDYYAAMGYSPEEAAAMQAALQAEYAAKQKTGTGSGSSDGSGSASEDTGGNERETTAPGTGLYDVSRQLLTAKNDSERENIIKQAYTDGLITANDMRVLANQWNLL